MAADKMHILYTKEDFSSIIGEYVKGIEDKLISFPYKDNDEKELFNQFEILKDLMSNLSSCSDKVSTKFESIYSIYDKKFYISKYNQTNKNFRLKFYNDKYTTISSISDYENENMILYDYFFEKERMSFLSTTDNPTIILRFWQNHNFMSMYLKTLFIRYNVDNNNPQYSHIKTKLKKIKTKIPRNFFEIKDKDINDFNKSIRDRIYIEYGENKPFKITWIISLIKEILPGFNCDSKWLDISVGWGSCLMAAMAAGVRYTGIEFYRPHEQILNKMISNFGIENRQQIVFPKNINTFKLNEKYDFILSNLVYFHPAELEYGKFKDFFGKQMNFDSFIKEYYKPLIQNTWKSLKNGGKLIILLEDYKNYNYVDKILEIILDLRGSKFLGIICVTGEKLILKRPVWIFTKE